LLFLPTIGLEVHAELATRSKMFCGCPVVDSTRAAPNTAVCPVCAGMPGTLPVTNRQAVELGLRVALALECMIPPVSVFARKNYFYPDLPKGYQISQYEQPLATEGRLVIDTPAGERLIRIRRVHLEEDTGKLTHVAAEEGAYSLVDLNRAGVPLLEIVSEPDLHSLEEVRAYAGGLRALLRELGASSGDMEKGAIRFEANVSIRPQDTAELGTRVEIKNLNSFRSMERAIAYELERQQGVLEAGGQVAQETLGWDDSAGVTFSQRSKEEAHDYRYFPEPDLPPLVVSAQWVERVRGGLPELPRARLLRLEAQYGLGRYLAALLAEQKELSAYFEAVLRIAPGLPPAMAANWLLGEVGAWLNRPGAEIGRIKVLPWQLAGLLEMLHAGQITQPTAKAVLAMMLENGGDAAVIVQQGGLGQVSDGDYIAGLVRRVVEEHPQEAAAYRAGKLGLLNWFFGLVMKESGGRANPEMVKDVLEKWLS
jgi:aspartyl-tRNA(Asn)/glutamyl-tRNA(Gln) amidotransferase subunit B